MAGIEGQNYFILSLTMRRVKDEIFLTVTSGSAVCINLLQKEITRQPLLFFFKFIWCSETEMMTSKPAFFSSFPNLFFTCFYIKFYYAEVFDRFYRNWKRFCVIKTDVFS